MGNISDKNIKKINRVQLKKNHSNYLFISIYTDVEDVIYGTALFSEEDYEIEKAILEKKGIVFYGISSQDVVYYKYMYNVYGKYIGYDNMYFYENGLSEWLLFNRLYGNDEYPIYRYV
jgi:hypothetical protein